MFDWLKSFFSKPASSHEAAWKNLCSGDHVRVYLKDPEKVGITKEHRSLTFQRLDDQDIATRKLEGYVIRVRKVEPGPFEVLEISVVKQQGRHTRLLDYVVLKEETERIEFLGDINDKNK